MMIIEHNGQRAQWLIGMTGAISNRQVDICDFRVAFATDIKIKMIDSFFDDTYNLTV